LSKVGIPTRSLDDQLGDVWGHGDLMYVELARRRRGSPVELLRLDDSEFYAVYSHRGAIDALRPSSAVSSAIHDRLFARVIAKGSLPALDGAAHHRQRSVYAAGFNAGNVARWEREVIPNSICVALAELQNEATFPYVDLLSAYAARYPAYVIAGILGFPDEFLPQFYEWSAAILRHDVTLAGIRAGVALNRYLTGAVNGTHPVAGDGLLRELVQRCNETGIATHELVKFLRLLVHAGVETVARATGILLLYLLTDDGLRDLVLADHNAATDLFEETLRLEPPVQAAYRTAVEPVTIDGVDVPAGADILVQIAAANRDDARSASPDEVRLHRRQPHLSFGRGPHLCLGMALARVEVVAAVTSLLERYPTMHLDAARGIPIVTGTTMRGVPDLAVVLE
jgi:cytochrome P450